MSRESRTPTDALFSQIRNCLDTATSQPGLVQASVFQTEGYLRGIQGLSWETPKPAAPSPEDASACFLHDVRTGALPLRGRIKKETKDDFAAFQRGFLESFPEAQNKPFFNALSRLWVRWLAGISAIPRPFDDSFSFSADSGRRAGEKLGQEYAEGEAGQLATFLMDRRLHLDGVRDFLRMRGWFLGFIEHLRRSTDAALRERAEILNANFASIVLRAQHNAGPDYPALAAEKISSMMSDLDTAIANLENTEPEAAFYLKKNRGTVITRALHSGVLDYHEDAAQKLPRTLRHLKSQNHDASAPTLAARVYRALTNGKLA